MDWPETANFGTEERKILLASTGRDVGHVKLDKLDWATSKRMIGDWKIWSGVGMWLGVSTSVYAVQFFIPTIIKELYHTSATFQIYSIPTFLSAAACSVAVARLADRLRHRYAFIVSGILVAVPGYFIPMVR